MNTIKLVLTCQLPGVLKENRSITTRTFSYKGKISKKKVLLEELKEQKAFKTLNISNYAYNFMISAENPREKRVRDWLRMSKTQRLNHHLKVLADGFPFSYEIIN